MSTQQPPSPVVARRQVVETLTGGRPVTTRPTSPEQDRPLGLPGGYVVDDSGTYGVDQRYRREVLVELAPVGPLLTLRLLVRLITNVNGSHPGQSRLTAEVYDTAQGWREVARLDPMDRRWKACIHTAGTLGSPLAKYRRKTLDGVEIILHALWARTLVATKATYHLDGRKQ